MTTIGILGAGKVGITLAQLAVKAGYTVRIAGSGNPDKIALTVSILAPGAQAMTKEEVAETSDIIILALPLSKYASIPKDHLEGKLVIDSMNHWYEVDGPRGDTLPDSVSSSEFIQSFLTESTVIKALSHMGYHELHDFAAPNKTLNRKGIAIAGDSATAVQHVATIIDTLGFEPVIIGGLSAGRILEPGEKGFGLAVPASTLKELLLL